MSTRSASAADRLRQTRRLIGTEGVDGVVRRVRSRVADRIAPPGTSPLPVRPEDFEAAAQVLAAGTGLPRPLPWRPGEPLTIAWVDVPPGPGSGGQTTIYRMIAALEAAGHTCVVYLIDHHGWHLDQHRAVIAECWPDVRAEIRDVSQGIADAHAVFATCWESAYPVLASRALGARMYFVQDFEPMFHAAGSEYLLAEATYRFGFHGVTAGRWLADKLSRDYGMAADPFDFGCDLATYHLDPSPDAWQRRTGIAYYCRPSTPRRAHELAMAALTIFARQRPEVDIHLYGEPIESMPFRATHHGLLTPGGLNDLYNRCVAGLTLSATNVSLVPHEMLASGCIPVVNDAEHNRMVLDNEHVEYASATPFHLADALSRLATGPQDAWARRARAASASVTGRDWSEAGRRVEQAIVSTVLSQLAVAG